LIQIFADGQNPISFIREYGMVHKRFYDLGKTEVSIEKKTRLSSVQGQPDTSMRLTWT